MINRFDGPNAFLSNFFPSCVKYDTIEWPSVEHAYQAFKTFDINARLNILLNCPTAGQAKRIGRQVVLRPNWDNIKVTLMRELIRLKFYTGGILADELIRTYPHDLIEGNTWGDVFWGQVNGVGQNWLGKLLMERRTELMILGARCEIKSETISEDDLFGVSSDGR